MCIRDRYNTAGAALWHSVTYVIMLLITACTSYPWYSCTWYTAIRSQRTTAVVDCISMRPSVARPNRPAGDVSEVLGCSCWGVLSSYPYYIMLLAIVVVLVVMSDL